MAISNGRPDGYTTLTPFLVCAPAAEAIRFDRRGISFGEAASVATKMTDPTTGASLR